MKTFFKIIFSVSYIILYNLLFISANDLSENMTKINTEKILHAGQHNKIVPSINVSKQLQVIKNLKL